MKCLGLFAGIGGIEVGLGRSTFETEMLCEVSPAARSVLAARFPGVPIVEDVRTLEAIPDVDLVAAGFPCQDLSQAGRTKGIAGHNSSLVNEVFRLIEGARRKPNWLLFENVPFMLALQRGQAMRHLVSSIEELGYRWAYRVVDARSFGIPQRRRRVVFLASRADRPQDVLLSDDAGESPIAINRRTGRGFYWTEGRTGLGWALGAIPTLKGGSSIGIPSPPGIWFPGRRVLGMPEIRDAERLQGFDANWTLAAETVAQGGRNLRWKLVGNAVCVPMMEWVGHKLQEPSRYTGTRDPRWEGDGAWPDAAWGGAGKIHVSPASNWPVAANPVSLNEFLHYPTKSLSARATAGFLSRARSSGLRFEDGFLNDVEHHLRVVSAAL